MQCVAFNQSHLSNAVHIPNDSMDFDPDWEIDPKDLITLNKLGELSLCLRWTLITRNLSIAGLKPSSLFANLAFS